MMPCATKEDSGLSSLSEGERGEFTHHVVQLSPPPATSDPSIGERGDVGRRGCRSNSSSKSSMNQREALCTIPPRHFSQPRSSSPNGVNCVEVNTTETLQEKRVVELLYRASEVIKEERARSAALQHEIDKLRRSGLASPVIERLRNDNEGLKRQLVALRAELDKKQTLNLQLESWERVEPSPQQGGTGSCSLPCTNKASTKSSRVGTCSTSLTVHLDAGRGSYSAAQQRRKQSLSLQRQQLATPSGISGVGSIDSQKQQTQQTSRSNRASSSLPRADSPSAEERTARLRNSPKPIAAEEVWQQPIASKASGRAYTMRMITRLRRAVAPPPTREQLGEVIHTMVEEIVRDAHRRGFDLQMTRQAPCVYLCSCRGLQARKGKSGAPRIVHLSIDSGRLSVKVGGGHQNFLEYLERYCLPFSSLTRHACTRV